jgi:hypothetical protein
MKTGQDFSVLGLPVFFESVALSDRTSALDHLGTTPFGLSRQAFAAGATKDG